jgi:hypothetical protein
VPDTKAITATVFIGYSRHRGLLSFRRISQKFVFVLSVVVAVVVITKLAAVVVATLTAFSRLRRELITRSLWVLAVLVAQPERLAALRPSAFCLVLPAALLGAVWQQQGEPVQAATSRLPEVLLVPMSVPVVAVLAVS